MKYDEILKLLDAGYTRDEIIAMNVESESEDQTPDEPEETSDFDKLTNTLNSFMDTVNHKLNELQAANILGLQQPDEKPHVKTAEEAIEELIRPQRVRNKNNKNGGNEE